MTNAYAWQIFATKQNQAVTELLTNLGVTTGTTIAHRTIGAGARGVTRGRPRGRVAQQAIQGQLAQQPIQRRRRRARRQNTGQLTQPT